MCPPFMNRTSFLITTANSVWYDVAVSIVFEYILVDILLLGSN